MVATSDTGAISERLVDTTSKVELIIHPQFPGIELVSPVYYSDGAICYPSPDQKVDAGFTTQTSFNIDPDGDESIGALMCKLQRMNIDQL
jgi:hypothetical protein